MALPVVRAARALANHQSTARDKAVKQSGRSCLRALRVLSPRGLLCSPVSARCGLHANAPHGGGGGLPL